jgi:DNA-binding LacI/PurR family transcriptional regulator
MKVNIIEIAARAGTSIATVSRVLNNSEKVRYNTRKKILDLIEETGYKPKVRKNRIINICVLINDRRAIFTPYISEILNGISDTIMELGYEETFVFVNEALHPDIVLETLRERCVNAAIVLVSSSSTSYLETFNDEKFPFLLVNSNDKRYSHIAVDNRTGIHNALEFLRSLGHRRFLLMMDDVRFPDFKERWTAFEDFMKENDLGAQRVVDLASLDIYPKVGIVECSFTAMKNLIAEGLGETAILTAHDNIAFGILHACADAGIHVPEDLSVVGFNNYQETEYFNPPLTTISQNLYKIGTEAVFGVSALLNGRSSLVVQKVMPTELVIRKTTAPAKNS